MDAINPEHYKKGGIECDLCKCKKGVIYKITNPNQFIYIGQTLKLHDRLLRYKRLSCKNQIKLYNSLNKYGYTNHQFTILQYACVHDIMFKEKFWIDFFKTNYSKYPKYNGLNLCDGGIGSTGRVASEESKIKNSIRHKGKIISEETRKKISLAGIGRKHTKETKLKLSLANIGKTMPIETREKLSQKLKGRNEHCKKRAVYQIDLITNNILQEFNSLTSAAIFINKKSGFGNILKTCNGEFTQCYGYKWKYK